MPNPLDRLKDLHRKVFTKGQEAVAKEQATEHFEDDQALAQRVMKAAVETIDLAEQLAADGNPHKQRLAAIIKNSVVGAVEERESGRQQAEKEREPIEAGPFVGSSTPSEQSLPDSRPTASLPGTSGPPKKKRGRPPKNPQA